MSQRSIPEAPAISSIVEGSHRSHFEQIDLNSPRGLVEINQLAGNIFATHDNIGFQQLRTLLGDTPEGRNRVLRAVNLHDFPSQDSVGEKVYTTLLKATQLKEEISRGLILHFVEQKHATFGLKDYELDVLTTTCRLGSAYDELCLRWRNDISNNPLNTRANELNLVNQYAVIREIDGTPKGVSYAEAYPEQVNKIAGAWRELAGRLFDHPEAEARGLSEYFDEYAGALESNELDSLKQRWKDVDTVWMQKVKGRLQPLGSREYGYYDPNKIRVIPDFRLILSRESVGSGIAATQAAVAKYMGLEFSNLHSLQSTIKGVQQVEVFLGDDLVFTGSLDFQPSGQSLPNEDEVKKVEGTKTFLNQDVTDSRWQLALGLAQKVFPQDLELFLQVDTVRDGIEIDTAGHEFAEPLFKTDEIEETLGKEAVSLLNEDLANLSATLTVHQRVETKELPREILLIHAVRNLGVYLRYLDSGRGKEHLRPYYEGTGLQGLRRMIDVGFIYKQGDVWRINPEKLDALYASSRADLHTQAIIAETKSPDLATKYISEGKETPEVLNLLEKVNS